MALARPTRSSDLSSLDLKCLKILLNGIQFYPSKLAKQSRPSKSAAPFIFPAVFLQTINCVRRLPCYHMSPEPSPIGVANGSNRKSKLLLSYIKPHNPITSSSITRWIMSMLDLAEIDTKTFKAHSCASASSGLTTNQIMNVADWSFESVVQRFYYRPPSCNQVELQCSPQSQQIYYKHHIDM